MKSKITIILGFILLPFFALGQSTLTPLDQWKSTTTPTSGITQRTLGKSVIITGLSSGLLQVDSTGLLSAGGSIPGMWATSSNDYWKTVNSFFSTTSVNFWETTQSRWATTSNTYWQSVTDLFSTTSADYLLSTKGYLTAYNETDPIWTGVSGNYLLTSDAWSTTSSIFFANASTTIPKTYISNTFSALQYFGLGASTTALTVDTTGTFNNLYVGENGHSVFPNSVSSHFGTVNSYLQNNIQNFSNGASASSDYIATSDNGSDSSYYIDLGVNSSGYSNIKYGVSLANDGYLYTSDGNLVIGTASTTGAKSIKFNTGGFTSTTTRMTIDGSGHVGIGTTTNLMDGLTVDSGINSTWGTVSCDPGSMIAAITANTNNICGGWTFQKDGTGGMNATNGSGTIQPAYRINPGALGGNNAAGDGAILRTANLNLYLPNSDMKMEVIGRPGDVTLASTSVMRIGFANLANFTADTVVQPTSGCFFEASSTQANWWAICKTANNAVTQVNTNVASSSTITGESGIYRKFRIELTNSPLQAIFYIQNGYGTAYLAPITISTNVANNANMSSLISVGKASAGKANSFDIMSAKMWWKLTY